MDLVGNQGSTTVRITAQQVVAGAWSTATGDIVYASSASSVSALTIGSSEQILHVSAGIPAWKDSSVFLSTILTAAGDILIRSSGGITRLAGASSAAQLSYTTADGAIGPVWTVLDTGGLVHSGATTLGAGSSEQILHISGGVPAWKDSSVFLSTIMTAAGDLLIRSSAGIVRLAGASSGSILRYSTIDGAVGPEWVILDPTEILVGTSALAIGTSEQVLTVTDGAVTWEDNDGAGLPTTAGITSGAMVRQAADNASQEFFEAGTSGQVLQVVTGLPAWATVTGLSQTGWELRRETTQTITTGTAGIAIEWLTEDEDTDGFHSTVSNSSIVTIKIAGTYAISASVLLSGAASTSDFSIRNGSTVLTQQSVSTAGFPRFSVSLIKRFATTGDTLQCNVFRSQAGAILGASGTDQQTRFSGYRIGP